MKPEHCLLSKAIQRILMISAFLFGFLCLSGCITNKVLDLRRERETRVREATNFWSLAAVRSGYIVSGGDAFACVEFRDSPKDAPQEYTISLSQAPRLGRAYADFMPAGSYRHEEGQATGAPADLTWRLYPLQEAQTGCRKAAGESPFPVSELKVDTLQIRREDQSRLPEMLLPPEGAAPNESRLIEVGFHQPEPSSERNVLLLYLPAAENAEQYREIGIAGAFEPGSEWVNPYTLLVVPAVAADTAIITTIIMLGSLRYR